MTEQVSQRGKDPCPGLSGVAAEEHDGGRGCRPRGAEAPYGHHGLPGRDPAPAARERRIERLRTALRDQGFDAMLVTHPDNVWYLTGFTWGQNAYLLVRADRTLLVTRPTEYEEAREVAQACEVRVAEGQEAERMVADAMAGLGEVAFEPPSLSVQRLESLRACLPVGVNLIPGADPVGEMRAIKEGWELELIRQACRVFDVMMEEVVPGLRPGMSENEMAARLEFAARCRGADGFWFPSIVVSGPRTAFPHGRPSPRQVGAGELLKIDMGPTWARYPSDATRTVVFAPCSAEVERIYGSVRRAQEAALAVCRPGVPCGEVDQAARAVLEEAGYGPSFIHPVGHGVGGPPLVGPGVERPLVAGMVITVEPGVYVPGLGGVRIEDTVAITPDGREVLHSYPKDLTVL